jgi:hypothetical protein
MKHNGQKHIMVWWRRIAIFEGNFKWRYDEEGLLFLKGTSNDGMMKKNCYFWRELQMTVWRRIAIFEGNFKWRYDEKGLLFLKGTSIDGMMKDCYFLKGTFKWQDDEGFLFLKGTSSDGMMKDWYYGRELPSDRMMKDLLLLKWTSSDGMKKGFIWTDNKGLCFSQFIQFFLSLKRILSIGGCNIPHPHPRSPLFPSHMGPDHVSMDGSLGLIGI